MAPVCQTPWQSAVGPRIACATAMLLAALLAGCATTRMIDTEVQSFAGTPEAPRNATYRFDRLPSQEVAMDQGAVEAMATQALARAGPVLTADNPAYSVQVNLQILRLPRDPRYDPWMSGYGPGHAGMRFGPGLGGWGMFMETPWYSIRLHLVMRNLGSGSVAFESTALFSSPWPDSSNIIPVMLDAALQGFPVPPSGPRTVTLELPAAGERR